MDTQNRTLIGKDHPFSIARKDIVEFLNSQRKMGIRHGRQDIWVVSSARVFTKASRRLNEKLGIHVVNKRW